MAAPLGQALREDERGVTDAKHVLHIGGFLECDGALHHMWSSDFGSS